MNPQNWFKKSIPNLIAIAAFVLISAVFAAPALKGERIAPHDTLSWIYLSKEARDYYKEHGQSAHWTNSAFSGMPTAMIWDPSNTNWYGRLGAKILFQPENHLVNPIGFIFLSMLGAFLLLKALRASTPIAGIGAVAYGLGSYFPILIVAGHLTKVADLAFLPGLIGGMIYIFNNRRALGSIIFVLFLAFYLSSGHWQIIYYSLFLFAALGIYFLVNAIKQGKLKDFAINTGLCLILAGVAALSLYSALNSNSSYVKQSIRGGGSELTINRGDKLQKVDGGLSKDYAFSWSNGIGETFCGIVPNLYGGASGTNIGENSNYGEALSGIGVAPNQIEQMTANAPTYFGPQPFLSGPVYFGAIVCFLAILALFVVKNPMKWALFAAGLLMIIFSWGKNFEAFNFWMFDNFPLFNKFRSPNMALSLTSITMIALAFWGLSDFIKRSATEKELLFKKFKSAAYVSLGIVVLVILYSQFMMSHKGASDAQLEQSFGEHSGKLLGALKDDRAAMALKDGIRSLAFILVAAAALWALLKDKINSMIALVVIGLASTIDLWGVGKRYMNEDNFQDEFSIEQQYFTPNSAIAQILQDKTHFKVLDLSINTFNDGKTSYFLKTIGGYHPAKMQTYQDLIETQIGNKWNASVLNMLNTKYIITKGQSGEAAVPNPNAMGNAWFVSNIKFAKTADEVISSMDAPSIMDQQTDSVKTGFQPDVEAIVRDTYQSKIGTANYQKDANAKITLTQYDLPLMQYESNNTNEGFAVFSEIFYPKNWKAYIDGKETEIFPVNYVLRGIKVPAGNHKIEFKYNDESIQKAENFNLIGSILITLIILGGLALTFKKRREVQVKD